MQNIRSIETGGSVTMMPMQPEDHESTETEMMIQSRFGEVKVNPAAPVIFPNGILGLSNLTQYCLTEFPTPKMNEHFRLLQSLEDHSISFITMPMQAENPVISLEDAHKTCEEANVEKESALFLFIASMEKVGDIINITVNAKAPIIVDAKRKLAWQHVFSHNDYDMKHSVNEIIAS